MFKVGYYPFGQKKTKVYRMFVCRVSLYLGGMGAFQFEKNETQDKIGEKRNPVLGGESAETRNKLG